MIVTVFDIETDGLLEEVTKIHCLCYQKLHKSEVIETGTITEPNEIKNFIESQECLAGHNIINYDIPVLEKLLNISLPKETKIIDTLGLSWYLFPYTTKEEEDSFNIKKVLRKSFGLDAFGEEYGIPKPKIEDWNNFSLEEYIHRCTEDVKINTMLWLDIRKYLIELYGNSVDIFRIINYIRFKLECQREQYIEKCYIDYDKACKYLAELEEKIQDKIKILSSKMPKNIKYKTIQKPKKYFNKDGSISKIGQRYIDILKEKRLPLTTESVEIVVHEEVGNPNSNIQLKNWLFNLGWKPTIEEESISKATGNVSLVPKISKNGKLCDDLIRLSKDHEELEHLTDLFLLRHRKSIFETFVEKGNKGYVVAGFQGFTSTMRFKHTKPITNLPKVDRPYGKEIRSLITVPNENYILCGSDMSALEDTTKQHFMYFYDPDYVNQMRVPGFDPHLDIAVFAGLMTKEESDYFKELKKKDYSEYTVEESEKFKELNSKRNQAKTVNFAGIYGAGAEKISKTLKCDFEFAKKLHKAYWDRNISVKWTARDMTTKMVRNQLWVYNPVSKFWLILREEKDIFSAINQNSGVYCFDTLLRNIRNQGLKISLQYHDEIAIRLLKEDKQKVIDILDKAIEMTNEQLKLNVPLKISKDFGNNYAEVH